MLRFALLLVDLAQASLDLIKNSVGFHIGFYWGDEIKLGISFISGSSTSRARYRTLDAATTSETVTIPQRALTLNKFPYLGPKPIYHEYLSSWCQNIIHAQYIGTTWGLCRERLINWIKSRGPNSHTNIVVVNGGNGI